MKQYMNRFGKIVALSLAIIFVIGILGFAGLRVFEEKANTAERINRNASNNLYIIDAELNAADKTLTASQQVRYVNNEAVSLKELYFHLYPNAFSRKETAPFLFGEFERAYRNGFGPGSIKITSLCLMGERDQKQLSYEVSGVDSTILKVILREPLQPGKAVTLEMKYTIIIPPASERFGYWQEGFNMGNWYPVAAVYDHQGWNTDRYYAVGDPFYSDVSDYEVSVRLPKEYVIAASGQLLEKRQDGQSTIWTFGGNSLRDFAFVANTRFQVSERQVDGITVKSYYYLGDEFRGKEALELAVKAVKTFNKAYGKYPYPCYSVVATQFPSGMEYPGLVYISDEYYKLNSSYQYFLLTVVHETAHQWWYAAVGNDQIDEAWLDEGLTTYSEALFMERQYGKEALKEYIGYFEKSTRDALSNKVFDGTVLKSLKDFRSWEDYGPAVYDMGAMTINQLRQLLGDRIFFKAMRAYYEEYKFKIATTEEFIEICERVSNKDLDEYFASMLMGND